MKKEIFEFTNELFDIFSFKIIRDKDGNEYVVYKNSNVDFRGDSVEDKTTFEALENHVHVFDYIKREQRKDALKFAEKLGKCLIDALSFNFPNRHFFVYVTVSDHMVIRFIKSGMANVLTLKPRRRMMTAKRFGLKTEKLLPTALKQSGTCCSF